MEQSIQLGKIGKIILGKDKGEYIKIIYDPDNNSGYYIFSSRGINFNHTFDDWYLDMEELEYVFNSEIEKIEWLDSSIIQLERIESELPTDGVEVKKEDIKFDAVGKIVEGSYKGYYLKCEDDKDRTKGYFILLSKSKDFNYIYDWWYNDIEDVYKHFELEKWKVRW